MKDRITIVGKPMTLGQFAESIKRIQECKDAGEDIDTILAREALLEQRTAKVREETFLDSIWNHPWTWINLQAERPTPVKCAFKELPIGAPYKCIELGETYYWGGDAIYDWTDGNTNKQMTVEWRYNGHQNN
jgi:hypothetical protein